MLTTKRIYEIDCHPRSWRGVFRRRSCRRSGEWRPAAAARNRGLGRSGTPPARHDDLAARSSLHGSGGNAGDGSAAPGRKSPRWSAERRASRVMGRAAPHSRGSVASRKRDNRTSAPVGAPPTPPFGDGRDHKDKTRAQQRAAGPNNTALFDIVSLRRRPNGSLRAPRFHTLVSRASERQRAKTRDLGATRPIAAASHIALRESLRWVPALVPFGFASLHSAGTRDRRMRPPAGLALRGATRFKPSAPRHGKQRLVEWRGRD
jgi:hypothetical protein